MQVQVATVEAARLLHEGAAALAEMSHHGMRIDVPYLNAQIAEVEKEIGDLKRGLHSDKTFGVWERRYGLKTNLGSREQLGEVIFNVLGYPRKHGQAKKAKGDDQFARRTPKHDEAAFQDVDLEFVKTYFRWQKLEKILNTYFYGIRREMIGDLIHPTFMIHSTATYRSSCQTPNVMNIPNRNAGMAKRIRRCFIPRKGNSFVEVDYSGAEVRAACCYTHDPRLINDFTKPKMDPHGDTACEIFGVPKVEVTPPQDGGVATEETVKAWKKGPRDWIKNRFVFPQFFGSTYYQCAPHIWEAVIKGTAWIGKKGFADTGGAAMLPALGITVREHLHNQGITELGDCEPGTVTREGTFVHRVKTVEDSFWNDRFGVYTKWKKRWWNRYLLDGSFRTLSGFVIGGILAKNDVLNYPIQGFAFHWNLWSITRVMKYLKRYKMKALMVSEVHDSNQGDVPNGELQDYCDLVTEVMTDECKRHWPSIITPLDVEVEVSYDGASWVEKKVWTKQQGTWKGR